MLVTYVVIVLFGVILSWQITALRTYPSVRNIHKLLYVAKSCNSTDLKQSEHLKLANFNRISSFCGEGQFLDVFEVFDEKSNISFAKIGDDKFLKLFAADQLKSFDFTASKIVMWRAHISNSHDLDKLNYLWNSRRLLSTSNIFPYDRLTIRKSFPESLKNRVSRMQSLLNDLDKSNEILSFLKTANSSGRICIKEFDSSQSFEIIIANIKALCEWFRSEFPYFVDRCEHCGNSNGNSYSGIICPSNYDKSFHALVTETYVCASCFRITKFPRYNDVVRVLTTRRGRCGEYSAVFVRMLKALGYNIRWISDFADHLWVEVLIKEKWIHVDPCEAAVNDPLIYQNWGKNQTYIIAFDCQNRSVVDVTFSYTDKHELVFERRKLDFMDEAFISSILIEASKNLSISMK